MTEINIKRLLEQLQIVYPGKEEFDEYISHISDGYHTFESLYYQRLILFATIVNLNKEISWKALCHEDGDMYEGWFIVGIDTPEGAYTYHYKLEYWDLFDCKHIECAKHWDGHTDKDVTRLLSLVKKED